jgi:cytolethal distending toxin subunit A
MSGCFWAESILRARNGGYEESSIVSSTRSGSFSAVGSCLSAPVILLFGEEVRFMRSCNVLRAVKRACVLLFVVAMVLGAGVMPARAGVLPGGSVKIMNANSGLCLSPAGGGTTKNLEIVQYLCDDDPSRLWNISALGGNLYQIINTNSGLCLTIAGGNTERNIVSVLYTCDTDPSRRWRYSELSGGKVRFINLHSGLCLTVAGGGTDRNVRAVQFPCDGDPSRDWKVVSAR